MNRQSEDIAAIKKLAEDWNNGWDRSDAEGLLSLYAEDPILMPQGQPVVMGRPAIRSLYETLFQEFTIKGQGTVIEVEASGDLGYFWSSYTLTATPITGGDSTDSQGKSIFIVKRQHDNSWKIVRLMDNSDHES